MKYAEINKIFSATVAQKLAEGFSICTNTMAGSQGEIAFVNFIKDGKHYALTLDREFSWDDDIYGDYISMKWIVSDELEGDFGGRTSITFWRGSKHSEVIEEQKWYKAESYGSCNWFVDENEAKRITAVNRIRRRRNKDNFDGIEIKMTAENRKKILRIYRAKKQRGQHAIKLADINSAQITHDRDRIFLTIKTATNEQTVKVKG